MIATTARKQHSPQFEPHVTFAKLPLSTKVEDFEAASSVITTELANTVVRMGSLKRGTTFFRSVYIKLDEASSNALLSLQQKLYKAIGHVPTDALPEFAHLSLHYGDDEKKRIRVMAEYIGKEKLEDNETEHVLEDKEGMHLDDLWLMDCTGPIEEWKALAKIQGTR